MKTKSQVRIHALPNEDCPGNLHKYVAYANCARCGAELKRFIWVPDPFRALAIASKTEPLCSDDNIGRFAGWLPVMSVVGERQ